MSENPKLRRLIPARRSTRPPRRVIRARTTSVVRKSLLVPITNAYGGGDYTAAILVGSQGARANVILDTGSSTLAVTRTKYQPTHDTELKPGDIAQVVFYGTGAWAGPVVATGATIGEGDSQAALPAVSVAIAEAQQPGNFGAADGILGLAYAAMNQGYDVGAPSYPWRYKVPNTPDGIEAFASGDLRGKKVVEVAPYFDALDALGVVADKFAFYTLRSFPHLSSDRETPETVAQDPLNQGYLVLGGGEEQTQLYKGSTFTELKVTDDLYYNVSLVSVSVGASGAVAAAPLQAKFSKDAGSNAIVDTGTNSLVLANDVYEAVLAGLRAVDPKFASLVQESVGPDGQMRSFKDLDLSKWPDLVFTFEGPSGPSSLTVTPGTYWQTDADGPGTFLCVIGTAGTAADTPNQSIFGLPLLNNYYTVFDRSDGQLGVIKLAPIQYPPAQRVVDDRVLERFAARRSRPVLSSPPPLPPVDFAKVGKQAPTLLATPSALPHADTIVLCWADAEWAAVQHVFVSGAQSMPYSDSGTGSWSGWQRFADGAPREIGFWGYYRLVGIGGRTVLLFKSNAHLSEGPKTGTPYIAELISTLVEKVSPTLVLSTGTAGGTRLSDPLGTVNVVNTATLYQAGVPQSGWPRYGSEWKPAWPLVSDNRFQDLLFRVPTTSSDLQSLADQFNSEEGTSYSLSELNPGNLDIAATVPAVNDLTPAVSLLTTNTFVVADTSGNFSAFACVEMDDAVVAQVCSDKKVQFGSVRNVSDPAQNASLPEKVAGAWGSFVYEAYGFYSSYAGALVTWAILAG